MIKIILFSLFVFSAEASQQTVNKSLSVYGDYVPIKNEDSIIHNVALIYILLSQIQQESGFNATAVSPANAKGIAQFIPSTAISIGLNDPFNIPQALVAQTDYLLKLVDKSLKNVSKVTDKGYTVRVKHVLAQALLMYNGGGSYGKPLTLRILAQGKRNTSKTGESTKYLAKIMCRKGLSLLSRLQCYAPRTESEIREDNKFFGWILDKDNKLMGKRLIDIQLLLEKEVEVTTIPFLL